MQKSLAGFRLADYFGDRSFYRSALAVMLPVTLQQLIAALFNFADNLMVASLDELSMSAVNVANKPSMLYFALFFGFTGAGSILLSQYFGAKRMEACQRIFSVEMLIGMLFSLVYVLVLVLFPEQIMKVFVQDPYTVSVGVAYLRIAAWAYLPAAISSVCLFALRAVGVNMLPTAVSIFAILCNVFLNWVLIFGKLGFPQMGVRGAALGTLLARGLEMLIYVAILLSRRTPYSVDMRQARHIGRPLLRDFVHKALPLTVNEILWALGLLIFFWTYARVDESSLAALTIADQLHNLSWVLLMGMSAAVALMIGKHLGANEFALAKQNAKRLLMLAVLVSITSVLICVAGAQVVGRIFTKLSPQQIPITKQLIYAQVFFFPFSAINMSCFFLLRAGGDTRNTLLMDCGWMWAFSVPAALIIRFVFAGHISLVWAFFIVQLLMSIKVFFCLGLVKKGHWLRNITRPEEG